jgi:hypothetical protein
MKLSRRVLQNLLPAVLAPLSPIERWRLGRVDLERPVSPPPVFIIGAPRSGSTILYQVLTNGYDFDYISNLSALAYRSLFFAIRAHRWWFGDQPHGSFTSEYGRTEGLSSPNECGRFWYQWFPSEPHFVAGEEMPPGELWRLRATLAATAAHTGRPLLFKNLHCGQRLQVLRRVLPEAVFIFNRREPVATALSILRRRVQRYGSKEKWISVMPPNVEELRSLPYCRQVMGQVYHIERQISEDLQLFPPGQRLVTRYEDLCRDPAGEVARIEAFLESNGALPPRRSGAPPPKVQVSEGAPGDAHEVAQLEREAANLDWSRVLEPARAAEPVPRDVAAHVMASRPDR